MQYTVNMLTEKMHSVVRFKISRSIISVRDTIFR